ncbi:HD-GYP domain-containing protein [Actimicrobium sp. CCC2.4]|uniref:HD-GYP domain-containing protein n=1 Tax=Actimicrobium sp. CCC2.4 TaxID=3048606 RepID=UPI002AC9EA03|nr:HD-GYP domain-containing protein [Actimicrobium sp. CCC2.4]MEB0134678.1 HD-GYP domain-containing protein [Actimicrobium sp. CCC2.4]WPX30621.1 HD-GYP domain-containing protein [Actimicrobium sp. CCC2.4]
MLKKIPVGELRPGMYIHELCVSWLDSPFWKKSFLLEDDVMLAKVHKSSIEEVWIDTDNGDDVALPLPVAAEAIVAPPVLPINVMPVAYRDIERVSMADEVDRATSIVNKSREAVVSMFSEARMGKAIDASNAMPLVEEIAASIMRNPGALIGLARLKTADDYTYMHSVAVCALMIALASQLKLDDETIRELGLAGLLHDIGKMAVPMTILNKPGKLTDDEFVSVKQHPAAGHAMLLAATGIGAIALDVCLHHHEKMNGSGYPHRLAGEQISLYARMGAVCDVYDAITSNRPYKQGWCPSESLSKMAEWSDGHFDPVVFQAFVRSIGIYPVGTLVRMESGRLGVVVEQQDGKLLLPKVRVFYSATTMAHIAPVLLDLASADSSDKIVAREEAGKWGLTDINRYWLGDDAAKA